MWFFEVAILEITIRFFKFVWEILPIQPTIQTRKKSAPPLFLEDENFFQKSATLVVGVLQFRLQPTWPIFEKSSHLREKGGVLMLFKTTRHLLAKAQYACTTAESTIIMQYGPRRVRVLNLVPGRRRISTSACTHTACLLVIQYLVGIIWGLTLSTYIFFSESVPYQKYPQIHCYAESRTSARICIVHTFESTEFSGASRGNIIDSRAHDEVLRPDSWSPESNSSII